MQQKYIKPSEYARENNFIISQYLQTILYASFF